MADRVPSDHPDVESIRSELVRAGRTDRPRVRIPAGSADRFPEGVVRLVVERAERFTSVAPELGGDGVELRGAFDTPDGARDPAAGTDRLAAWRDDRGLRFGAAVLVDVVVPGYRYGLRAPGERAVYDASRPDEGLRAIAEDLLEDG